MQVAILSTIVTVHWVNVCDITRKEEEKKKPPRRVDVRANIWLATQSIFCDGINYGEKKMSGIMALAIAGVLG